LRHRLKRQARDAAARRVYRRPRGRHHLGDVPPTAGPRGGLMGYRGRLIWPFVARFARLDTAATAADPDGAGPLASGYDPIFREPVQVPQSGSQDGQSARQELEDLDLTVQVEDQAWEQLREMRTGSINAIEMTLVVHFRELEDMGLIDAGTGDALAPRKGDRLKSIRHRSDLSLVQEVPT